MARYKVSSVGVRGHVHLYEETRPLDNTARYTVGEESHTLYGNSVSTSGAGAICFRGDRYIVSVPGTASVEIYQIVRGAWTLMRTFVDPVGNSLYGACVSISGGLAAVGAPGYGNGAGRVYLYQNRGGGWEPCSRPYLDLFNEPGAQMGASLDLDGTMLVVGAPNATGGSGGSARFGMALSYLYDLNNKTWNDHAAVVSQYAQDGSQFGASVGLDREIALAVGAPLQNVNKGATQMGAGAVETFTRNGATWRYGTQLTNPMASAGDNMGASISYRADRVLVGAPGVVPTGDFTGGAALMFVGSFTNWNYAMSFASKGSTNQGTRVDQNGNQVFVSDSLNGAGQVHVWELTQAGNWLPAASPVLTGSITQTGDQFGNSISAYGGAVMVSTIAGNQGFQTYRFR